MSEDIDKMALAVAAASVVCSAVDSVYGTPSSVAVDALAGMGDLREWKFRTGKVPVKPNPLFGEHGHDGESPVTAAYLNSRHMKNILGGATDIAGIVSSSHTAGVSVPGAVMHGQASLLTVGHMGALAAIAARHRQSQTIWQWLKFIEFMKATKLAIRAGQTVGAAVPAAALGTSIAAAVAKAGVTLTYKKACMTVAVEIHWRAFQEQAISGGGARVGPASAIMDEVFRKRGATILFGSYDVAAFMKEPAGWLALGDKLMLI